MEQLDNFDEFPKRKKEQRDGERRKRETVKERIGKDKRLK